VVRLNAIARDLIIQFCNRFLYYFHLLQNQRIVYNNQDSNPQCSVGDSQNNKRLVRHQQGQFLRAFLRAPLPLFSSANGMGDELMTGHVSNAADGVQITREPR
jgi:hypothetical protein